jgi:hypothetical protein
MPNFGAVILATLALLSVVVGVRYPEAFAPQPEPEVMYIAGP